MVGNILELPEVCLKFNEVILPNTKSDMTSLQNFKCK